MNKKFLLAAMALPMMFTACSEEELFEGVNNNLNAPQARGFYATIAPSLGEGDGTRALWDGSKLTWEDTDLVSVYWLGDQDGATTALNGKFNSIFKTEDGNAFTSESMVFEGGNIAVFPGNTSFYKEGDITVKVPLVQDETTILKTPYISNYLDIVDPENPTYPGLENQIAGYNNGLYSPMKMAANVLYLNIELANTANLAQYGFKVNSVSLVRKPAAQTEAQSEGTTESEKAAATRYAFGSYAKLMLDGEPNDKGKFAYDDGADGGTAPDTLQTIKKAVKVATVESSDILTSKAITKVSEGKYLVKFVVLPTGVNDFTADAEIVINTNCGRINLTSALRNANGTVANKVAAITELGDASTQYYTGLVSGYKNNGVAEDQTIAQTLNALTALQEASATSNFAGEFIGKKFTRTVKASMADATLNDSEVTSSEEIINYVNIYKAMGSTETMNLILTEASGSTFVDLTSDAIKAMDSLNYYGGAVKATLSMGAGMTGVQLAGTGALYFNNDEMWKEVADNSLNMVLAAGSEWTMDDNYCFNKVGKIINNGTLTVSGTADNSGHRTLVEKIENNGTLNIAGDGTLQVGANLVNVYKNVGGVVTDGIVNVAQGQNLLFNEDVTEGISGTINVEQGGFLTVAANKNVTSNATINNYGLVSAEKGNGGIYNEGTINVLRDGAITYVQDNADGVINLLSRNNEAVVYGAKGKIVYNYVSATDGTTFARKADDKFTYVVFGEGNSAITLATTEMEVDGVKAWAIKDLSMEFTSETNLVTNGLTIKNLTVVAGAHLQVLSDNNITVDNLNNNGVITLGGTITYNYRMYGNGKVYSVGNGAIKTTAVAGVEEVESALTAGKDIVLGEDLALTSALEIPAGYEGVIDLNGYTLESVSSRATNSSAVVTVAGKLTIKNGKINAGNVGIHVKSGNLTVEGVTIESAGNAIKNNGGTVTIESGSYKTTGEGMATIYCDGETDARDGQWFLTINDGTFRSEKFTCISLQNNYYGLEHAGNAWLNGGSFQGGEQWYDLYISAAVANYSTVDCTFVNNRVYVKPKYDCLVNGEWKDGEKGGKDNYNE